MNATGDIVLAAEGLSLNLGGNTLLDGVALQLRAGEVVGIVGPNGAGKSTLLKTLAGVQAPNAGAVLLDGKPVLAMAPVARARVLAWLEQSPVVHWPLVVEQVVALGRLPHGDNDSARIQAVLARALEATDCSALRTRSFHTLSEGEKVRVHLARVLVGEPRIVLADEPIAALDPWHQLQVLDLLRTEAARGTAVALVLHDLQLAARYCDRLLLLNHGRVVACGTPREVLTDAVLAAIWRVDARFDSATLSLTIHGRASASAQSALA